MEVVQVYNIVNEVTREVIGESVVVNEDLSNIIDVGTAVFNANAVDNYVRSLVDRIGRVVFVDRPYRGNMPNILMNSMEYGAVVEKITMDNLPVAEQNESWELQDRTSYDPNIFYKPQVSAKFFSKKVTFEIPISITDIQVRTAFTNAQQVNSFVSMIYNAVETSLTLKIEELSRRTINNMIGETIYSEYQGAGLDTKSGMRAVNLLKLYNDYFDVDITKDEALLNPDFIRFAAYTIAKTSDRMTTLSTLFNVGGKPRHTTRDMQNVIMLSDFARAADVYLQADTFHDTYTRLLNADLVPFWQGSGTDYSWESISSINIKTATNNTVEAEGILCVIYDRDALGINNFDRRTTSNYNSKAEFTSMWYKYDAQYFNDTNENFVVFFIA